jgi:hypothetical protein
MLLPSFSDPHLFSASCPPRSQSTFENGIALVCVVEAGLLPTRTKKEAKPYHSNLETVKALLSSVSKLFRNVPFLTSLKMSPFFFSASFSFLGGFLEKVRARKLQERRFPSRSTYGIPLFCWPGPERSPAEPAGRSV